ncbi:MAG: hypothetical protein DMG80_10445 [Acidobacteria bacterium]|nr:MAG: hypothetical protein DMG80_10445 [Acidobacteriota bacterium]
MEKPGTTVYTYAGKADESGSQIERSTLWSLTCRASILGFQNAKKLKKLAATKRPRKSARALAIPSMSESEFNVNYWGFDLPGLE